MKVHSNQMQEDTMDSELTELEKTRLEKVNRLRENGVEPYPTRSDVSHTTAKSIQAMIDA